MTGRARLIATFRALEAEHRKFMENLTRAGLDASGDIDLMQRRFMLQTSARNRLLGTVIGITPGAVNGIRLRIAGGRPSPPPSPAKAQELGLAGNGPIALIRHPR